MQPYSGVESRRPPIIKRRGALWAITATLPLSACTGAVPYHSIAGFEQNQYTIRAGESLYAIAWRYGLDYKQVARWNGINEPYTIYPGQKIRLNPPLIEPQQSPPAPPTPSEPPVASSAPVTSVTRQPTLPPPTAVPVSPSPTITAGVSAHGWQWPAHGHVIRGFSPADQGGKGIDIAGVLGAPVHAASGGEVVYSGGGLVGYGELVIIKHDETFLSAYAHNRKLLVGEGEQVRAGQMIAELGSTGTAQPMLHFEIRRHGQPVDPLEYLPVRP
jgi:lipoprotein NlpD